MGWTPKGAVPVSPCVCPQGPTRLLEQGEGIPSRTHQHTHPGVPRIPWGAPCQAPDVPRGRVQLQAEAGQVVTPMDGIQHGIRSRLARPAGLGGGWLAQPGMPRQGGRGEPRPARAARCSPRLAPHGGAQLPPAPPYPRGLWLEMVGAARVPLLGAIPPCGTGVWGSRQQTSGVLVMGGAAGGALGAGWLCC